MAVYSWGKEAISRATRERMAANMEEAARPWTEEIVPKAESRKRSPLEERVMTCSLEIRTKQDIEEDPLLGPKDFDVRQSMRVLEL